jgi:hypothetical protein
VILEMSEAGPARAVLASAATRTEYERKAMKKLVMSMALALACIAALPLRGEVLIPQDFQPYAADLLARVRVAATVIPGALPARINYVKLAESHRPLADIIEGGSQENYVSARTAFQVVYPSGTWAMIDSGMDQAVHKFFGFGREEPYWPERNAAVDKEGEPHCRHP